MGLRPSCLAFSSVIRSVADAPSVYQTMQGREDSTRTYTHVHMLRLIHTSQGSDNLRRFGSFQLPSSSKTHVHTYTNCLMLTLMNSTTTCMHLLLLKCFPLPLHLSPPLSTLLSLLCPLNMCACVCVCVHVLVGHTYIPDRRSLLL